MQGKVFRKVERSARKQIELHNPSFCFKYSELCLSQTVSVKSITPPTHTHHVSMLCLDRVKYFPAIISPQIYSSCLQGTSFWVQKIPLEKNGFSVLAWRRLRDGLEPMTHSVFHEISDLRSIFVSSIFAIMPFSCSSK